MKKYCKRVKIWVDCRKDLAELRTFIGQHSDYSMEAYYLYRMMIELNDNNVDTLIIEAPIDWIETCHDKLCLENGAGLVEATYQSLHNLAKINYLEYVTLN